MKVVVQFGSHKCEVCLCSVDNLCNICSTDEQIMFDVCC